MTENQQASAAMPERPIWERCWCWQYGRCLTDDCPTADLPRPRPMTTPNHVKAWEQVLAGTYSPASGSDGVQP